MPYLDLDPSPPKRPRVESKFLFNEKCISKIHFSVYFNRIRILKDLRNQDFITKQAKNEVVNYGRETLFDCEWQLQDQFWSTVEEATSSPDVDNCILLIDV